ncbi:Uncharacterized protein TCM_040661 [Theobroma cacao]|uniref:Cysteine-rich RLK (RECEPTOR-like protein kinase) 8 n=1 Tax=Theobroma cacao TaxID=3641 RepID=A0A061GTB6_THECC|nr:Uncharacterized protein TCM_040661 [Theobroma cacao]
MDNLGKKHLIAAHRILKYLKGLPGQGILMKSEFDLKISSYVDSDKVECPDTRRLVTRFIIFIKDSLCYASRLSPFPSRFLRPLSVPTFSFLFIFVSSFSTAIFIF